MILAFDVTDRKATISWRHQGKALQQRTFNEGKATNFLLPAIDEILGTDKTALTAIGVIKGPGSFTGIRVGLATAMGLSTGLGIPAYGFTKYQLAEGLFQEGGLLLPAGRGRVLMAHFRNGSLQGSPETKEVEELDPNLEYRTFGDIGQPQFPVLDLDLTAKCIDLIQSGIDASDYDLQPLYIRPPDAIKGRGLIHKLLAAK